MVNKINISDDYNKKDLNVILRKSFQSANINFLIGSGCSNPAIKPLGNVEKEINELFKAGTEQDKLNAEVRLYDFLLPIAESNNRLKGTIDDADTTITLNNYREFLYNIFNILTKRKSNILTKQATIFSTNYDLFIKKASEEFGSSLKINDGFNRNPKLDGQFKFSATEFFNAVYNKGNLYNYKVEIPSINLIKLHGSLSWGRLDGDIVFQMPNYVGKFKDSILEYVAANDFEKMHKNVSDFNGQFQIILPIKDKLRETLLDRIYYNLLRIYANELDKENTLLIAEGISFEDEHILDITQKALRNPTLRLVIFCYQIGDVGKYESKFRQYKNVDIVFDVGSNLGFAEFNNVVKGILSQDISQVRDTDAPQEEANNAE
jgi:hypothetical protein